MRQPKLTVDFWDCNCVGTDYIRSSVYEMCAKCGAVREDQPDSHLYEVEAAGKLNREDKS